MSLSPSKIVSGSKKTTVRNATKAGVKSLEPRSRKNNIRRRPREEVPLFKFKGQGKGLLHLPEKQSYTGDASNTNSKVISVRPAVAEANTPSRRKFVNHTSPPQRMVPSKTKAERPISFAMRCVPAAAQKSIMRESRGSNNKTRTTLVQAVTIVTLMMILAQGYIPTNFPGRRL